MAPSAQGAKTSTSRPKIFRRDHGGAQLLARLHQRLAVDVGDPQLRAGFLELAGEVEADVAHALDGDAQAVERVAAERSFTAA
jgi:hypothetical protein